MFDAPAREELPLRMSGWNLPTENYNHGATRSWRNHDASFLRFDTIQARDGQTDGRTDGQTDTLLSQRPARRNASAGKNLATNVTSTWPQLQSCRISVNLGVDCIVVYSTNVYSKLHPHNTGVRAWIYCRYNAPGLQRRLPVPMWTK